MKGFRVSSFVAEKHFDSSQTIERIGTHKLYLVFYQRNAWYSTWVSKFQSLSAIYSDLDDAKRGAENARTQGSQLFIREFAAPFWQTNERLIYFLDPNGHNWLLLSIYRGRIDSFASYLSFIRKRYAQSPNVAIAQASLDAAQIAEEGRAPWHYYRSVNVGSNWLLNWYSEVYALNGTNYRSSFIKFSKRLLASQRFRVVE